MSLITVSTAPVVAAAKFPVAAFSPDPVFGVIGSVVRLDGRPSTDPDQLPLTYEWRFVSVPIGSQVQGEGFRAIELESVTSSPLVVSFSPDVVGEYVIGLVVSNGVFSSVEVVSTIRIRAILVPHGRGIIPDGKFIWTYIRDVWSQVDGREFFETLWSALIQIVGSEMLKLYQVDFNKSIRDIQDKYQRRWLSFEPKLLLDQDSLSFFIGNHIVGQDASTVNLGLEGLAVILSSGEVIVVVGARLQNVSGEFFTILYSEDPANVGTYELSGLNATRSGYRLLTPSLNPSQDRIVTDVHWTFDIGETGWALENSEPNPLAENLSEWAPLSDSLLPLFNQPQGIATLVKKGDVIHFASGPNAGFYRIVDKIGTFVTVDKAPPAASQPGTSLGTTIYRPVGFKVTQQLQATTNTFSVSYSPSNDLSLLAPGRIVVLGGQSFTIIRSVLDTSQATPVVVVTLDSAGALYGLRGLNWRAPHTLLSSSQDFEELGVSTGDLIAFDIVHVESGTTSEIPAQVVGVRGGALGFVLTDGEVPAGQVPPIPNKTILKLANDFGIDGVSVGPDGTIVYSGTALAFFNSINSGLFKKNYWNTELTPSSNISVNPLFQIKPKYVIRNRLIPVDSDLRSVPSLQEWIQQPNVSQKNGKFFQVVRGKEFEIPRKPVILGENLDYLIDDETVFQGQVTINTGSNEIETDDADFVDRGMVPGDSFIIESPLTLAGTYIIEKVLSNTKVRLTRTVPAYVLGPFAIANITLLRKKSGHFLRFVPGLFTAQNPAPARLWAEVSLFDNNQTIEDNFGILVGLKKSTLDLVSRNINYRQAVAGLMFAYTRGSALDKVRLGAQILLGLPFAEHKGIIRSIEDNYRLDINGIPILGRLLIEDVDSTGKALGTLRIYLYPIDTASVLAGVDVNPATGKTYVVGDTVELFAPLSKGVEIIDYETNPRDVSLSAIAQLQKFHTVKLRANDNIFSLEELDLVSDFLRKITPSYVSYSLITASEFADTVNIVDLLLLAFRSGGNNALVDNASLGLPATLMFDSRSADGTNQIRIEDGIHSVRRVGIDLVSTDGTSTLSSASGGFLNPKANEDFEAPLTLPGDLLVVLDGQNQGVYPITAVPSDTQVTVTGPAFGFEAGTGILFAIVRPVPSPFASGTSSVTSGNQTVVLGGTPQLRSKGVAPGDWLIIDDGTHGFRHIIKTVKESSPGSGVWDRVDVTPLPTFTSGITPYSIYRPSLLVPGLFEVVSSGTPKLDASANLELEGLVDIGDELVTDTVSKTRVTVLDPRTMHVTPTLPAGTYLVTIARKNRASSVIGWDHIEKYDPIDAVEVGLVETQARASCTATLNTVTLQDERTSAPASGPSAWNPVTAGVMPGDLLVLTSGGNSTVDVGLGAGVYPIVQVAAGNITLSVPLTVTGTASWKIVRRR